MPEVAYQVARRVAQRLVDEHGLQPPFDLDELASRFAELREDAIPAACDGITLHPAVPGDRPMIVVQRALSSSPARRRFAIAHELGHVVMGWHALGAPCDVSTPPSELPITVHDLVEGEANAFARELLLPTAWLEGMRSLDRPVELVVRAAGHAGVPVMAAARAVARLLPPHHVWAVVDQWERVLDAGRSPGTRACPPVRGSELTAASFARHARARHRVELEVGWLELWEFDDAATESVPHDRTARDVVVAIAADLQLDDDAERALLARVEGAAGWANEQLGAASLDGMRQVLGERVRALPGMDRIAAHAAFDELVEAKAVELVARRLSRA